MRPLFCPVLLAALVLTSCQVPSAVTRTATSPLTGEAKVALPPFIAGLESPTWGQTPPPPTPGEWKVPTRDTYTRVRISRPVVALTFDDGPHPEYTPKLLDILKARQIKATFYVLGPNVKRYPHIVRRMVEEGHEVGNHSVNHPVLARMSEEGVRRELRDCHEAIVEATGVAPLTMRPPYGSITAAQKAWIHAEFGYPTILWSADPLDWKKPGAATVASRLISGASPGGILLAHDIHAGTIEAMPQTIDRLQAMGYEFATVAELIALEEPEEAPVESQSKAEAPTPSEPATAPETKSAPELKVPGNDGL